MSAPLAGKAFVVTGPAKGMGAAITLAIARAGGDLALIGRDLPPIEDVAAQARALGRTAVTLRCDVRNETDVAGAVDEAARVFGHGLFGAVNVAGVSGPTGKTLWEHSAQDFHDLFDANVLGVFLMLRAVLPQLIARNRGSVVTIGGTFGFKGVRRASVYGATKWALRGLTKSSALEAGAAGVRVNMVSPGGVDGPRLSRQLREEAELDGITYAERYARFEASTALRRMSSADDVAQAVLFLLSDASRNITGQDLLVDGGTIV